ncbi:MAG: sigma-54-dependent Fis family transcriptional regulator [Rhodobacterales bacterium]|nr:sigma-54-dependent Fis family transcriptional regulator [Rhodobacterales bacterium]
MNAGDGGSVILVDDEADVLASIGQTLELEGFTIHAHGGAAQALEHLDATWPGIILSDVKMPRMDGLTFLDRAMAIDPDLPFVIITAHGDIPMTVAAMRRGAYDFIEKTAEPERLIGVVRRALEKRRLVLENRRLRQGLDGDDGLDRRIIGAGPAMAALRRTVAALAPTDVDILIHGETGTGKELVARCLHDFSLRRDRPFVALNCGALPEHTIESELFGHEAGAFTGASRRRIGRVEYADGGTLFLDEIESMPVDLQVKLLRVLQERSIERLGRNDPIPVDIRVIAATKTDLLAASRDGTFRDDLYYRLNVGQVALPPLRDRPEDLRLLFGHFTRLAEARYGRDAPDLGDALVDDLMAHDWPGNVRELRNAADRFVLGLPLLAEAGVAAPPLAGPLAERLDRLEREIIRAELDRQGGRVGLTAQALGLPRKTLYLRMRKHGLRR